MEDLELRVDHDDPRDAYTDVEYIYPLEEVKRVREHDYDRVAVPTAQGELLLEFIKKHILK